ncbi:hypothetical protein [Micromonospora sp. RV43]|uniref:hypothetical protein n=1 Tax=Micromonospora sp. RV43 TaxID=1661387 RepID=UPI00064C46C9|nr:hypothetical protein [Micromonospora sp. RV43]
MQTIPTLKRLFAAGTLAALVACGTPDVEPTDTTTQSAEDCDKEDLAKREDDCGRYVNGVWTPWSWVSQGRRTPPRGWTSAHEPRPSATSVPQPVRTTGVTAPKPASSANTPRQTTTKKTTVGTTRRSK